MNRKNTTYKKYVDDIGYCELCGSKRNLELHHIIPLSINDLLINNVELETEDNYICVCEKCHSLLTPKKILTKIGLAKVMPNKKKYNFYRELNEILADAKENGDRVDACDVLDVYERIYS